MNKQNNNDKLSQIYSNNIKCEIKNNSSKSFLFIIFLIFILSINYINLTSKKINLTLKKNKVTFEKYETNVYNDIKNKLIKTNCSLMWGNQKEFINGIVRNYRPKKIIELGVKYGGSSIVLLNAIKDIENSHLYSIDINTKQEIGVCVEKHFPFLSNKWTLFKGDIAAKYMKKIGKNIDLAMIDTSHFEPGEILDFLMILPFLKEESIVIFHDIDNQITFTKGKDMRHEWAPYIIFNLIRGEKYLPLGSGVLNKDIGAIKLEKNQRRFVHDYCRALGGQWEYFPPKNQIKTILKYFKKYYDKQCYTILKETISFNRIFVKNNPKENFYIQLLKRSKNSKKNHTMFKVKNRHSIFPIY